MLQCQSSAKQKTTGEMCGTIEKGHCVWQKAVGERSEREMRDA